MKFSTKEDIDAPIEQVFGIVTDFEAYERAIMRRGAELQRVDTLAQPGQGMKWQSRFSYRGRPRELAAELTQYLPHEAITLTSQSQGLNGVFKVDLVALSPRHTRMAVTLEMKPNSITARLFLQSLRLAKSNLTRRFKKSVRNFARDVEARLGTDSAVGLH